MLLLRIWKLTEANHLDYCDFVIYSFLGYTSYLLSIWAGPFMIGLNPYTHFTRRGTNPNFYSNPTIFPLSRKKANIKKIMKSEALDSKGYDI